MDTYIHTHARTHTHAHTHLTALFPGLPRWAGTRKVKPIWILLKKETVSGSGISWAACKSAPCSKQTTTPAPHHSVSTGRMPFLPPNQQRQSTEGCSFPVGIITMETTIYVLLILSSVIECQQQQSLTATCIQILTASFNCDLDQPT